MRFGTLSLSIITALLLECSATSFGAIQVAGNQLSTLSNLESSKRYIERRSSIGGVVRKDGYHGSALFRKRAFPSLIEDQLRRTSSQPKEEEQEDDEEEYDDEQDEEERDENEHDRTRGFRARDDEYS
ncbi:hypothetical protein BD560DRAFT_209636 [Blakeslea trispora]|nr:hypothetical protein BD560DRAFT_209636 [Blakeslea trispora]